MTYDFIVIGGGVVGMSTARELAKQHFKVALFDKGQVGMEASWAAGGILSSMRPWAEDPGSAALSDIGKQQYQSFVEALKNSSGIDAEYYKDGLFMLGSDDVSQTKKWAVANKVPFESVSLDKGMKLLLPSDCIFLPEIAQVRPSRLLKALKKDLQIRKVDVFEHIAVKRINIVNSHFKSISTESQETAAGNVIVATGAWSQLFTEQLGINTSIKPINGQMLCVKSDKQPFKEIVLDGGHYLIPRNDGQVLIGSSMEDTGFEKVTTNETKGELLSWARQFWPGVIDAMPVTHWAGLRPSNITGKPIIGSVQHIDGVFFNTGHFRKGILQASVSAKLLVQHIMKNKTIVPIEPYAPQQ